MHKPDDTFLTPEEVAALTGIKTGKRVGDVKLSREQLQVEQLRTQGIPFTINARGRPMVFRANMLGMRQHAPEPKPAWQPRVLHSA